MARLLPPGLRILVTCILISVGTAFAEDSDFPNVTATFQAGQSQGISFSDLPDGKEHVVSQHFFYSRTVLVVHCPRDEFGVPLMLNATRSAETMLAVAWLRLISAALDHRAFLTSSNQASRALL
jgi:hypothetical protein